MQEVNTFTIYTDLLNKTNINYFITGSIASIIYGEPRLTHDVDLILNIRANDIDNFISAFPLDEFYCPPKEVIKVEMLRSSRGHFNLIHHNSGFKADIYLTGSDFFQAWGMKNRKEFEFLGHKIFLAPVEYVIIKKLEFYKEGNEQKHLIDIKNILDNSNHLIDFDFLNSKINELGLNLQWDLITPKI